MFKKTKGYSKGGKKGGMKPKGMSKGGKVGGIKPKGMSNGGKVKGYKKAIVTLKKGQSIDLTTGI